MNGTITILNIRKNCGFIRSTEAGKKVVFFDKRGVVGNDLKKFAIGDFVTFEMKELNGRRAVNIIKNAVQPNLK